MARKLDADFEGSSDENVHCDDSPLAPAEPTAGTVLEDWLRSDPKLTTDKLINSRHQQTGGHHD